MLQLWLCADRKQNTARMLEELCGRAENGVDRQLLLVPEQFSHSTERILCRCGGERISRFAEVLGFSRLASRVFAEVGGCAESETDPAGRLLAMSLAAEQVRSRLKIYGGSVERPEFLLQILDTFDEFRSFRVSPARLRKASSELSGALAVKTEEFALLMESFEAVCANMGQSPKTRLNRLLDALEGSSFAAGRYIYFDGFTDFNGVEREIIAQLLAEGAEVCVNLHCDDLRSGGQQFESARGTAKILLNIARTQEVPAELHHLQIRERTQPLPYLRSRLFSGASEPYPQPQKTVALISGADRTAECRAAAGEILRLVENGARWRDISVACADFAAYRPILESVFRCADIPTYFAGNTDILRQPVVHMLLSALDAASGAMEQETVLAYLKSGFLPISRERCDRLENYILLWNIRRFDLPWEMNPYGLRRPADEAAAVLLVQLNDDRLRLFAPLLRLRDRLRGAGTTAQMVVALERFLADITLEEQLKQFSARRSESGDLQQAQEYAQVYAILCGLMEQMYGVLGDSRRSPEDFYRIFRTALTQCSIGTIPARLDCVTVGDLKSQRRCDTKTVFLLGANEGYFPAAQSTRSLFTDGEREHLLRLGIELLPNAAGRLDLELASVCSVLNAPEERLYLGAVIGQEAYLYRRAAAIFPDARRICDDTALIRRSRRDYLVYLAGAPERSGAEDALSRQAKTIANAGGYRPGALQPDTVQALYGKTLRLSSSKIDQLASCRFAYFLNYGLRAEERRAADDDPTVYGTFVHYVLEQTTRQTQREGGFSKIPLERVLAIAEEAMERFAQENLSELWQSPRSEYLFRRNFSEVRMVVTELYRELSQSRFEPEWFELHFAQKGDLPSIPIEGTRMRAELEGFVDRADIWRDGEREFVRVIDYKTGKKAFAYSDIFYGLGMQMLIYLFALEKTGERLRGQPLTPAGVLYFPARIDRVSLKDRSEALEVKRKQKRSGLLLEETAVLQAMEPCEGDPQYLPYGYDKKGNRGGDLASGGQFHKLERFVFHTVAALGDELYSGEIAPNPYYFDVNSNACRWCPYASVCRNTEKRWLAKIKTAGEFWSRLEERDG